MLSQFGKTVVVLEQHEVVGGGAHQFAVNGKSKWRFDAGLHFTVPQHELLLQVACGAAKPPVPCSILGEADGTHDRIALGAFDEAEPKFAIAGDEQMKRSLCERFPRHAEQITNYLNLAQSVQLRFALWVASALLPMSFRLWLLRSPLMSLWRKWASVTTAEAMKALIPGDDEETKKLRAFMTGLWLDTGSPPTRMSFWMQTAVFGGFQKLGVGYPVGGPQEMALAMVEAIESRGGAVFVRTAVSSILMAGTKVAGVQLANGVTLKAARVVSGLGYRTTLKLLPQAATPSRPLATQQACGFVMANIALNGSADELGITNANLWLQPATPRNHYDVFGGIDAFMEAPLKVGVEGMPMGITFPSLKDASWEAKHPGTHCCQILVPISWAHFEKYYIEPSTCESSRHAPPHVGRANQAEYDAIKREWEAKLVSALNHHFPKTVSKLEFCDISTPLTIENYLRSGYGTAIGLDVTPARFVEPEEVEQLDMKYARLPGLWLAGQDALMCGQVCAAAGGMLCALRMLGPLRWLQFAVRAVRLLLPALLTPPKMMKHD
uniref:Uncharacterized protein n=1 Tax=Calcidiscus leptoporus TaxID=127549 RepID=A0A6U5ML35_9EUKA